jgi:adenylosuccinate synthase
VDDYMRYAERLRSHVTDTSRLLYDALREGKEVLLEGAQGTMLDLDKGTYPFVTSSNPVTGYALASAGIGPREVERVIGITKAYVTRVGAGPFPTEDHGPEGDRLGERGQEFGTVTGRKRRCGWFDAVILRYAARVNGLTELFVTKLDVLSGLETVRVCTAYRVDDETFDHVPPHQSLFHRAEPVYEELEGWEDEIGGATAFGDLPAAARKYLERVEELVGVAIGVVSVGPGREQSLTSGGSGAPTLGG